MVLEVVLVVTGTGELEDMVRITGYETVSNSSRGLTRLFLPLQTRLVGDLLATLGGLVLVMEGMMG